MKENQRSQIISTFETFFRSEGYELYPSQPLIPRGDKTVLLTNATITPYKKNLTGELPPLETDVAIRQRCVRIGSEEEVGSDPNILCYFEMLGLISQNRSLDGLTANVLNYLTSNYFDLNQLKFTVHQEDTESYNALIKNGVKKEDVRTINGNTSIWSYWNFGKPGVAGYGITLLVDSGTSKPEFNECDLESDQDRYIQLLNIIKIDEYVDKDGNKSELRFPGIDVGCGVERLQSVIDNKNSFECGSLKTIVELIYEKTGINNGQSSELDRKVRIIADQTRSALILISEGIEPGNKSANYLTRKTIRRATTEAYLLTNGNFLKELAKYVVLLPEIGVKSSEEAINLLEVFDEEVDKTIKLIEKSKAMIVKYSFSWHNVKDEINFIERMWTTFGIPKEITTSILNKKL